MRALIEPIRNRHKPLGIRSIAFLTCLHCLFSGVLVRGQDGLSPSRSPSHSTAARQNTPPILKFVATTSVYQTGEGNRDSTPREVHQIVFDRGVIYDFPHDTTQPWTVIDLNLAEIVLLDRANQTRTRIATESLIKLAAQTQSEITNPEMRERLGMQATVNQPAKNRYELAFAQTSYRVRGESGVNPEVAIAYGQFIDWMCRLNLARPRGLPPFARMTLNQAMVRNSQLPSELNVTIGDIQLKSLTRIDHSVSADIQAQIEQAAGMRVIYQDVAWEAFDQ